MYNLETPKKFGPLIAQARQVADEVFRPISRRYDREEHARPKELDMLAALVDGMNDGSDMGGAGAAGVRRSKNGDGPEGNRNGSNLSTALSIIELCRGDVGLLLSMPRQGLGNSAIASVADDEQLERFAGQWAAMAITEPEAGSDSRRDPDDGGARRRRVHPQRREDLRDGRRARRAGRGLGDAGPRARAAAAIKSFVVERTNPGLKLDRLEHKLGIRASDTAAFTLQDCRVPKENLLGPPEIAESTGGFAGAMQTFDNTRPLVAAMAVGLTRACLEETSRLLEEAGVEPDWDAPAATQVAAAAEYLQMDADYEAAYLLTLQAAWMADNGKPNSLQAS